MSIILVTGSTDGIGLQTAMELARLGHEVVVHGRSTASVQRACATIQRADPAAILSMAAADLSDFAAVQSMAQALAARLPRLDVLINNAGVYQTERRLTSAGFELTLAVNYLAPFLLTQWLLPLLQQAPAPRVVTVSSVAHESGRIEFDNLNGERRFDPYEAYANSKLAVALFATGLARRAPWLTSNYLHPGVIDTKLLHAGFSMAGAPTTTGAQTPVYLATAAAVAGISGKYFERCAEARPAAAVADAELACQLWEWTAQALRPWLPE